MKKLLFVPVSFFVAIVIAQPAPISINALHFDGANDYVSVPYVNYNLGSTDFTIEAWIRDESPNSQQVILSNRPAAGTSGMRIELLNGKLTTYLAGIIYSSNSADLRDNACHHIAVTRQAGSIKHYVDGILAGPILSGTNSISSAEAILIGAGKNSSNVISGYFTGLIKEVRLWTEARSQSQIQSSMNIVTIGSFGMDLLELLGYWRFNEGSGQTAQDWGVIGGYAILGTSTAIETNDPAWTIGCPSCIASAIITPVGNPALCPGANVTLNASIGTSYQWKLNSSPIAGATSASFVAIVAGNYTCTITGTCGSATSNIISVTNVTVPSSSITAAGPTIFCSGNSVALNANTGNGLSWQWKKNTVSITGATNASYSATSSGTYTCLVSNNCGSATSNSIAVTVNTVPVQPGTISGPASVCHNQNNVTYSIAAVANATSYTWTVPSGAQIKSGQGTLTIKVRFGNAAGNITVKANNSCGSGPVRSLGIAMPCRDAEADMNIDAIQATIFPNPSSDEFSFVINFPENTIYNLKIVDITGRVVEVHEFISTTTEFKCGSGLMKGIYFAEIISGENKKVLRLIKEN